MFKNYTRQYQQLLTIHNGGSRTCHTIGLAIGYTTTTNKQNRPVPSHGTQLCNAYTLQLFAVDFSTCATDHYILYLTDNLIRSVTGGEASQCNATSRGYPAPHVIVMPTTSAHISVT